MIILSRSPSKAAFVLNDGKVAVRTETLNGKEYLVAPVVAIREGVLNGELVPAEEIGKQFQAWNGVPVTINHPKLNGEYVSASSPEYLGEEVGRFYNVQFDGNALKGDIWLDVEKINQLGGEALIALERLQKGLPVEVSTGYWAESTNESGVFRGQDYTAVQSRIIPDHLALLPNGIGACSWEDGCGAPRVNDKESEVDSNTEKTMNEKLSNTFKSLAEILGFRIQEKEPDAPVTVSLFSHKDETNEDSFISNGANLSALLNKMIKDQTEADRPRRAILQQMADMAGVSKDKIQQVLSGDISFIPFRWLSGFASALDVDTWDLLQAANLDGKEFMIENLPGFQAIFANNESGEDREDEVNINEEPITNEEVVEETVAEEPTVNETELRAEGCECPNRATEQTEEPVAQEAEELEANAEEPTANEPVAEEVIEAQPEAPTANEPVAPETLDEAIDTLPDPFKKQVREALDVLLQVRQSLVESIKANSDFTEDDLDGYCIPKLQKLNNNLRKNAETDFGGRPLPRMHDRSDEIPAPPPVILQ